MHTIYFLVSEKNCVVRMTLILRVVTFAKSSSDFLDMQNRLVIGLIIRLVNDK